MQANPNPFDTRHPLGRMIEDLPASVKSELEGHFQLIDAPSQTLLVNAGEHTNVCFYVFGGILGKFDHDGTVSDIFFPDDIYYPTESDAAGFSPYTLRTFSDSLLLAISIPKFETLKRSYAELQDLETAALKYEMLQQNERRDRFDTMDPHQRYLDVLERYPGADQEIPFEHIASWLGVDVASLNRIRASIASSKLH